MLFFKKTIKKLSTVAENLLFECCDFLHTNPLFNGLSFFEKDKSRNRSNSILLRWSWTFINITFCDDSLSFYFCRELFESWKHCLTWTTPRCPKIDKHKIICAQSFLKRIICNFDSHNNKIYKIMPFLRKISSIFENFFQGQVQLYTTYEKKQNFLWELFSLLFDKKKNARNACLSKKTSILINIKNPLLKKRRGNILFWFEERSDFHKSSQTNNDVYNFFKYRKTSKKCIYKVKIKRSNESPIESTDDHENSWDITKWLHKQKR